MSASLFSLGSRVFSVTGGASGMGAATVRLLAQHGAGSIWIADWNDGNFGQIKEEVERINPLTKVHTHKVDVSDPKQVDDWVASIMAESGVLHGAANVAGLSQPALLRSSRPFLQRRTRIGLGFSVSTFRASCIAPGRRSQPWSMLLERTIRQL